VKCRFDPGIYKTKFTKMLELLQFWGKLGAVVLLFGKPQHIVVQKLK
jgi:hypothetical protein